MAPLGDKSWSYLPSDEAPTGLDIVWVRFPLEESPNKPGDKFRPGLVRSVKKNRRLGIAEVEITYGTSKLRSDERPFDLILSNNAGMAEMGLPRATRFDLDRTVWLPWASEFFAPSPGYPKIILGKLNDDSISQLRFISAERAKLLRPGRLSF